MKWKGEVWERELTEELCRLLVDSFRTRTNKMHRDEGHGSWRVFAASVAAPAAFLLQAGSTLQHLLMPFFHPSRGSQSGS
jgi:hypothetical protein